MKLFNFTKRKLLQIILIIVFCLISINIYNINLNEPKSKNSSRKNVSRFVPGNLLNGLNKSFVSSSFENNNFMIPLTKERLNELFKILLNEEVNYKEALKSLDLIVFSDLIKNKNENTIFNGGQFSEEIKSYFEITANSVSVNDNFLNDLKYLSNYYSYIKPRDFVEPKLINVSYQF